MNKAILVIDMPNACEFCPMFIYEKCFCQKLDEYLGNDEADLTIERSSKCPLKELPYPYFLTETEVDFIDAMINKGWNACIRYFLGDKDE